MFMFQYSVFNGEFKSEDKKEKQFYCLGEDLKPQPKCISFLENVSNLDEKITLYLTFPVGF